MTAVWLLWLGGENGPEVGVFSTRERALDALEDICGTREPADVAAGSDSRYESAHLVETELDSTQLIV